MNKMKTFLIVAISLLTYSQLHAQTSLLNFNEDTLLLNGVLVNVGITILKGDIKEINKSWESFIKTHLNEKMKEEDGVLVLKEIVINQVTDKRGDLLTYTYNKDNEVSFNVAYKLGYDVYLNSTLYPTEFEKFKEYVYYFVYNYYNDYLPQYIKEKNKNLKVLKKEISKAEKSIKKSEKQNKKLNKSNSKSNKKIGKMDKKIYVLADEDKKNELSSSKSTIEKEIAKNEESVNYNSGLISAQKSVLTNLKPKIEIITTEINSAKITLIEVETKIKTSK